MLSENNYFMYLPSCLLVWLLDTQGDINAVISGTNFAQDDFNNPLQRVRFIDLYKIIQNAYTFTEDPALGLTFGQQLSVLNLGIVGQTMANCNYVKEATDLFIKYYKLYLRILDVDIHYDTKGMYLKIECTHPEGVSQRFYEDAGASAAVKLLKELVREDFDVKANFKFGEGGYEEQYRVLFSLGVTFNQPENVLFFEGLTQDTRLAFSNPVIASENKRILTQELELFRNPDNLINDVKHVLKSNRDNPINLSDVAKLLGYSPRNLRRALMQRGRSFRTISAELKSEYAANLLRNSQVSVGELARIMGYDSYGNFSRAFKKWLGTSPAEYRRQLQK